MRYTAALHGMDTTSAEQVILSDFFVTARVKAPWSPARAKKKKRERQAPRTPPVASSSQIGNSLIFHPRSIVERSRESSKLKRRFDDFVVDCSGSYQVPRLLIYYRQYIRMAEAPSESIKNVAERHRHVVYSVIATSKPRAPSPPFGCPSCSGRLPRSHPGTHLGNPMGSMDRWEPLPTPVSHMICMA